MKRVLLILRQSDFVLTLILIAPLMIAGCGVYSFSGSALSPEVETVTIENFPNNADLREPTLSQTFTQKLRDKFLQDTRLELVQQGGDLVYSGSIKRYEISPDVVENDRGENLSKLTIGIQTKYENKVSPDDNFDKTFTQDQRFNSNQALDDVEQELIDEITERIIQNIFNQSVNNW